MKNKHVARYFGNFIFFCASLSLFEVLLRLSTSRAFDFAGFSVAFILNAIFTFAFCSIMCFVSGKAHVIVNNIILAVVSILYISQIIYFSVFGTFYNIESMLNAGQIAEFRQTIIRSILEGLVYILLCLTPIPIYNLLARRGLLTSVKKSVGINLSEDRQRHSRLRLITLCVSVVIYFIICVAFVPFAKDPFTPYSMFFGQHDFEQSVERTGLLSTLQIGVLRIFIPENATGALHALDELRDKRQAGLITPDSGREPAADKPETTTGPAPDGSQESLSAPGPPAHDAVESAHGQAQAQDKPEPIIFNYNVMEVDFDSLIADAENDTIRAMHEYFAAATPSGQNEFTGMFDGYNLIMFVAEAFSPFAVREDLTPTLYKLVHDGFYFSDFYTSAWGVSTSDGEYVACTGLLPKSGVWSFFRSSNNYLPFTMGNRLGALGYSTFAYHNHTHTYYRRHLSHPNMGYDVFKAIGNGLELPQILWPNSDLYMVQATVDDYIYNEPFHAYYMTVSGHLEYNWSGNAMAARNRAAVEHLPYSEPLKAYIATHIELDKALEYLLDRLNKEGIAERTLIVLSSDHHPYGLPGNDGIDGVSEFLGRPVEPNFELYKNYLIIYAQGMEAVTVDKPGSSLDIIPTISNLMGLEFDSRFLMGRDLLSDGDPLVIFVDRSFITENGRRIRGGHFIANPGADVDDSYSDFMRAVVDAKFAVSANILDFDYYRIVFGDRESGS